MLRTAVSSRDTGKSPASHQASGAGLPFEEHQLKQLRAQCLVFLAFRNGLMPKKLHLEIALGNFYSKQDGTRRDLIDQKEKEQLVHDPTSVAQVPGSLERPDGSKGTQLSVLDSNSSKEAADFAKFERISQPAVPAENEEDKKCLVTREEAIELRPSAQTETHDDN